MQKEIERRARMLRWLINIVLEIIKEGAYNLGLNREFSKYNCPESSLWQNNISHFCRMQMTANFKKMTLLPSTYDLRCDRLSSQ